MQIDLAQGVAEDLTLREGLLMALGSRSLIGESRVLRELASLRERLIDSDSSVFGVSEIEKKYCTNAVLLSDYDRRTKFSLIGALDA